MPNPAHADQIAIAYLVDHAITARRDNGVVVTADGARVRVLYSTPRLYGGRYRWKLPYPIDCDVVMLIGFDGKRHRFYLFDPDNDAFYYTNEAQKRFVTWYPERVAQRHHQQRYDSLTTPAMQQAQDRLELIERVQEEVIEGER